MDRDVVISGLLHDTLEDTNLTREDIQLHFNKDICSLVEGVSKLSDIKFNSRKQKQADNFMKMFLSIAKDIRVIIIKFADRLHNLRTIDHLSLIKQRRVSRRLNLKAYSQKPRVKLQKPSQDRQPVPDYSQKL